MQQARPSLQQRAGTELGFIQSHCGIKCQAAESTGFLQPPGEAPTQPSLCPGPQTLMTSMPLMLLRHTCKDCRRWTRSKCNPSITCLRSEVQRSSKFKVLACPSPESCFRFEHTCKQPGRCLLWVDLGVAYGASPLESSQGGAE